MRRKRQYGTHEKASKHLGIEPESIEPGVEPSDNETGIERANDETGIQQSIQSPLQRSK
jgi:hypothetical protein